jgi:hypothetical protein
MLAWIIAQWDRWYWSRYATLTDWQSKSIRDKIGGEWELVELEDAIEHPRARWYDVNHPKMRMGYFEAVQRMCPGRWWVPVEWWK